MDAALTAADLANELTAPEDDNEQSEQDSQNVDGEQENQEGEGQDNDDTEQTEGEDADGEEGDEETDATDEQTDKDSADTTLEWESNGEKIRATQKELKEAFEAKAQAHADYTQKTQNLARERQEAEARVQQEFSQVQAMSTELGQLGTIDAQLKEYQGLDWQYLRANDPLSYSTYLAEQNNLINTRAALANQIGSKAQQLEQQLAQSRKQVFEAQTEEATLHLSKAIPGFNDPTQRKAILAQMKEFGTKSGFTAAELAQVADKRSLEVLYKAAKYDELQAKKPAAQKKVAQVPTKANKPSVPAHQQSKVQNNLKRVVKTGRVRDFAALLGSAS